MPDSTAAIVGPDREAALAALPQAAAELDHLHRQARRPAMAASAHLDVAARACHAAANGADAAEAARRAREAVRAWDAAAAHIHALRDLYPEARP